MPKPRVRDSAYLKEWRKNNPEKLAVQRARWTAKRKARKHAEPGFAQRELALQKVRNERHFEKTRVNGSATWLLKGARSRAAARGLPYDLDAHKEHYQAVLDAGVCEMTGLPFVRDRGAVNPMAPSLDRIVPELGYTHGNVRIVVWALNRAMGKWGFDFLAQLVDRARTTSVWPRAALSE